MTHNEILEKDKNFEVYRFCKEHNIECSWDFSKSDNAKWTEVFVDGKMVFQFEHSTTAKQFIEVVNLFTEKYDDEATEKIDGDDFWFVVGDEDTFTKFIDKHGTVFKINSKFQGQ